MELEAPGRGRQVSHETARVMLLALRKARRGRECTEDAPATKVYSDFDILPLDIVVSLQHWVTYLSLGLVDCVRLNLYDTLSTVIEWVSRQEGFATQAYTAIQHCYGLGVLQLLAAYKTDVHAGNCGSLATSCRMGATETVLFLLQNGAKIRWSDEEGHPLLHAVNGGHLDVVQALCDHGGADITVFGNRVLYEACWRGHKTIVQYLAHRVPIDDARDILLSAARLGELHVVQVLWEALLESGSETDIDFQDDEGNSMLVLAIQQSHLELAEWLLVEGADADAGRGAGERRPLLIAVEQDNLNAVRLLLDHGADPTGEAGSQILTSACVNANIPIAEALLDCGADDSVDGEALVAACASGNGDIVALLVSQGAADLERHGAEALCKAIRRGHLDVVELLVEDGRALNECGVSEAMACARECGFFEAVSLLEGCGGAAGDFDRDQTDARGWTSRSFDVCPAGMKG